MIHRPEPTPETMHMIASVAELHHGDCLDILRTLPDNSIDAVVTDPPYGLSFMGKRWDYDVPSEDIWRECLRVLKPGGHLLAFAGTRTQHRMAVRIEDAGFEIRDMIAWVYGSGFPKSLDVSKAIDKQRHDRDDIYKVTSWVRERRDAAGIGNKDIDAAFGFAGMAGHWTSAKSQPAVPTLDQVPTLLGVLGVNADDVPADIRRLLWDLNGKKGQPGENWAKREVVGKHTSPAASIYSQGVTPLDKDVDITAPATDAAKQWHGWGTALKPALEPITVARKPLIGTVAENVLRHGTGGVNVDGCRVGTEEIKTQGGDKFPGVYGTYKTCSESTHTGRWPANLIHDGSDEVVGLFPETKNGGRVPENMRGSQISNDVYQRGWKRSDNAEYTGDSGSAARFFYCAKASKRDRDEGCEGMEEQIKEITGKGIVNKSGNDPLTARFRTIARNNHPTVKPTDLMRYLCRLVTPPGGIVLDPFMGSGSTGKGAILEGFRFVGIEREAEYIDIARARIQHAVDSLPNTLFDNNGE